MPTTKTITAIATELYDLGLFNPRQRHEFEALMTERAAARGLNPAWPIHEDVLDEMSMEFTWPA